MGRISNISYHPTALAARPEPAQDEVQPPSQIARDAAPLPPRSANVIDERLHEEFETARRWIELAARSLIEDPILRQRHASALHSLDQVSKTIGQLARVIMSEDKEDAIGRIESSELKARMQRRPISPLFESKH